MPRVGHALGSFPWLALLTLAGVFGLVVALVVARRRERHRRRLEAADARYEGARSEALVHG